MPAETKGEGKPLSPDTEKRSLLPPLSQLASPGTAELSCWGQELAVPHATLFHGAEQLQLLQTLCVRARQSQRAGASCVLRGGWCGRAPCAFPHAL